ncbi:hypothetical protein BKA65DRAFT_480118 [Rhexocercosporidium sp. MPI-PUGE-AT-0058]|nr:hypothetical protein BKA65DRAFT_480118 [Rhexocercosporidium sp. MPI-PUGE-AT-0058]
MDVDVRSFNADDARPDAPIPDDFTIALTTQMATDIMLDRLLKPKATRIRNNNLPLRSSFISKSIEDLKTTHRKLILKQITLLETTFGPGVCNYEKPKKFIARFEEDCNAIEAICASNIGISQTIIFAELERLYTMFGVDLRVFYDGLLTCELEARFDLEMKKLRRRKPETYPFYYLNGALFMYTGKGKRRNHLPIVILPIPELTIRQRLLDEALHTRSGHTDRFEIFRMLVKEVKRKAVYNTLQMERMIRAMENRYRSTVFAKLCSNIDKQAKIIIRRFGIDYFFSEDREFATFLQHWAHRYCNVAQMESEEQKPLAQELGKVLYALLEFLKVSHDALLERDVDAKMKATTNILIEGNVTVTQIIDNFTVCRAKIDVTNGKAGSSRERLVTLMNLNEISYATGELEEVLQISPSDLTLPFDNMLFKTAHEDEESDESDSDSDSEDEMFPPLRDDFLYPIWHTPPAKGKLQKCVSLGASKVPSQSAPHSPVFRPIALSVAFPSLKASQQRNRAADHGQQRQIARSMAATPGTSNRVRAAVMHGSSPIPSPARLATPASKMGIQAVNNNKQNSGMSKSSPILPISTPSVDQHNRRQSEHPNQGHEKTTVKITNQKDKGSEQQINQAGSAKQPDRPLNKWLNDANISATTTLPTAQRSGEPFFSPSPNMAAHIQSMAEAKKNKKPPQAQPRYSTQEEAYQASRKGTLVRQQAGDAVSTDFGKYPSWPASVVEVGQPLEDNWTSKRIPVPEGLKSWDDWSLDRSERRSRGYELTDEESSAVLDHFYD